jgi:hypothetical protein
MAKPRRRPGFAQKAKPRRFITDVLFVDDLQCHPAVQIDVERFVGDSHRTATQLHRLPVFAPYQFIVLESLHLLIQRRRDRFLRRRVAGLNPTGKTLAQKADRTELHCSRKLVAATRAGALGFRYHGSSRPSVATLAESNTTLHRVLRNRPARSLANCCSVVRANGSSFRVAPQLTFRNKIPSARVVGVPAEVTFPLLPATDIG